MFLRLGLTLTRNNTDGSFNYHKKGANEFLTHCFS